ncbi:MAG: hypothetical protein WBO73_04585, partial [Gammaproteobacteria bacterium]
SSTPAAWGAVLQRNCKHTTIMGVVMTSRTIIVIRAKNNHPSFYATVKQKTECVRHFGIPP